MQEEIKKYDKDGIIALLNGGETTKLKAREIKNSFVGNTVYIRGLIELSNKCIKNCFYCGIRSLNNKISRYTLTDNQIISSARYAYEKGYGNVVLQAGERWNEQYTDRIARIIEQIKTFSKGELSVTLSLGEQTYDVYKKWHDAGADRYLLRIETSSKELYQRIHPKNELHSFENRLKALDDLKNTGYQVGTGVMIGLPTQTIENLADDIIFMRDLDIDMCGMGPYIEHSQTPLAKVTQTMTLAERYEQALVMVSTLRCVMPTINIAATTALQTIKPTGREDALSIGANVIMPNISPANALRSYSLYNNKPIREGATGGGDEELFDMLSQRGFDIGLMQHGDSLHYRNRMKNR
ncbi:MAG: [FeFe] hydrogenase H-cluster radical SAM maturase HydE [Bacteroidetes bacterium]|nr:[FeFe] hydrogenase H-cluster radical SAM maturase HydE [Bacteroidota bacterium]